MSSMIQRVENVLELLKLINYSYGKLWKPSRTNPFLWWRLWTRSPKHLSREFYSDTMRKKANFYYDTFI